jgi:hypothetical protein
MAPKFQDKKLWLNMNVLFVETEKEAILIDLNNRTHYYPNETASIMLNLLTSDGKGPIHFDDVKKHLMTKYKLKIDDAEKAVDAFCDHLKKNDLLGCAAADVPATGTIDAHIQKKKVGSWANPTVPRGVNSGVIGYVIIGYRP